MADLPSTVRIREVGPRDGFQNEPEVIPTGEKVRLIGMLVASGISRLEVTSFVRPDVIPQLADAEEVLTRVDRPEGVSYSVLVPNQTELERTIARAREAGLRCEGAIAVSFGCPYEGEVPPERVFGIAERLAAAGCDEVAFGDTTGMANPRQVREFFG